MAIKLEDIREMRKKGFSSEKATSHMEVAKIISDLEDIGEDMKNHYPRISEADFVKNYLFAFAGVGDGIEDNYASYLSWIHDVAGNYNTPVHVCGANANDILFTVPGICNLRTINPELSNTKEVHKAISMANDARFLQPYNWEVILKNNLNGILRKLYDSNEVKSEDQEVWKSIIMRYENILRDKKPVTDVDVSLLENSNDKKTASASTNQTKTDFSEVDDPI